MFVKMPVFNICLLYFCLRQDCSLIPANLVEAFALLINCSESSPCHPLLPTVQHTLKKAIDPEGLLYLASKQFTTEDFEKVKVEKMSAMKTRSNVSQFK